MYPTPNPSYGITPAPAPEPAAVERPAWERVPGEVVRLGPAALAGVVGAFVGRGLLGPLGVPVLLALLAGAVTLGPLLLGGFRRLYALTSTPS